MLNETHDPALTSWLGTSADFPIQNLPFAEFRRRGAAEPFRGGVAICNQIIDLQAVARRQLFSGLPHAAAVAAAAPQLNDYFAMGHQAWSALRFALSRALRVGAPQEDALRACLVAQTDAEFALPCRIGDYTDFYASKYHATAVGRQFRPDNPLLPNYHWMPIAYHGRASSVVVSPASIRRPNGQLKGPDDAQPRVGPSARLDYEVEVGIVIGVGNSAGVPIPIDAVDEHVFGVCLLNDWSARDIQAWEYQPLGPFLAKNFATSISPWLITLEALAPFRRPWTRDALEPQPLAYLDSPQHRQAGSFDIQLTASLRSAAMWCAGHAAQRLSSTSFRHSYWSVAQMVAHHTVNGCNLLPGDLLGSGTQSGPEPEEAGSLVELTVGGSRPLTLPDGEHRTFLADGDTVTLSAWCQAAGAERIGFGEVSGTVAAA